MKNLRKAIKYLTQFNFQEYEISDEAKVELNQVSQTLNNIIESGDIVRKNPLIGRTLELSERGQLAVGDLLASPVTVQKVVGRRLVVVDSNGLTAVVRRGDLS